jgi:hypothetical protein
MHLTMTDLERAARERLSAMAWGYCASGADDQTTLTDNLTAFDRIRLLPRFPVDVSDGGAATGDASCARFAGAVCAAAAIGGGVGTLGVVGAEDGGAAQEPAWAIPQRSG